ncbi:NIPSNAP family protein [Bacillus sp. NPDC057893]|uniref:NIPSNAP family protein n=1 Tax=Bacillus sp. NPDC057893 TaxID=3346273 RepID=UPI003672B4FF
MFYRRKYYIVKNEFVEIFNNHFNDTNLPNQLKYGSRLIGRWMKDNNDGTTEIFTIWEYDSYEDYVEIETKIRNDKMHGKKIYDWYERNGGKEYVLQEYILEMRNEELICTVKQ